jgi:hypothetical protein
MFQDWKNNFQDANNAYSIRSRRVRFDLLSMIYSIVSDSFVFYGKRG